MKASILYYILSFYYSIVSQPASTFSPTLLIAFVGAIRCAIMQKTHCAYIYKIFESYERMRYDRFCENVKTGKAGWLGPCNEYVYKICWTLMTLMCCDKSRHHVWNNQLTHTHICTHVSLCLQLFLHFRHIHLSETTCNSCWMKKSIIIMIRGKTFEGGDSSWFSGNWTGRSQRLK